MKDERQWLYDKLRTYEQRYKNDSTELRTINKIKTFSEQNKNCFSRLNREGHITGSAWIVNETFDAFLLVHHRKLGWWLQLGGHADGESNILNVALREAQEESGLSNFKVLSDEIFDVDVHPIPERLHERGHFHFDIRFLLQTSSTALLHRSVRESFGLAWVPLSEILENPLYKNVRKMAIKSKEMIASPLS